MTLIILLVVCESVLFLLNWIEFVEKRGKE